MYHISDIHICRDNYANILSSFGSLLKEIRKSPGLLVIAGDVFDTRAALSSDDINLFCRLVDFLEQAKIPTLIIPGTHDFNPRALHKNDNIELLLKDSDYVTHASSGALEYAKITAWVNEGEPDGKGPHAAVLHAEDPDKMNGRLMQMAQKFDIVAAGGDHTHQFFAPNGAYSGGFVQRGSEDSEECGFVRWDLSTYRGTFVPIPQKSVYLTLTAENNLCPPFPRVKPKHITVKHSGCSEEWLAEYMLRIRKNYKRSVNFVHDMNNAKRPQEVAQMVEEEGRLVDQRTLLGRILEKVKAPPDIVDDVVAYHSKMMEGHKLREGGVTWSLKNLSWSHIYCYGENNNVNFESMGGLVSIVGENKIGKSAIIDILIYALFGECMRGGISDMLNKSAADNKNRSGIISCQFAAGANYVVTKTIKGKRAVIGVLKKDGVNISSDVKEMTHIITELIGKRDEFVSMVTALQNRQFLVDMRKEERSRLIARRLNISAFAKIEASVLNSRKVAAAQIKRLSAKVEPFGDEEELNAEISFNERRLQSLGSDVAEYREVKARLDKIETRPLVDLLSERKKLVRRSKRKVAVPRRTIAQVDAERRRLEKEKHIISGALFGMTPADPTKQRLAAFKKAGLARLLHQIDAKRKEVAGFFELEFNDECAHCTTNRTLMKDVIVRAKKTREDLEELMSTVSAGGTRRLSEISSRMEEMQDEDDKIKEYRLYKEARDGLGAMDAEIKLATEKAALQKRASEIDMEDKLAEHRIIESILVDLRYQRQLEREKNAVQKAVRADLEQVEAEKRVLDYYLKCIDGKTGIPSLMMKSVCAQLTKKCCDVLGEVADFGIEIVHEKEVKVYTYDYSNEKRNRIPAEMGSGYQKFVIDMVMRIVFAEMSQAANPRLLFIDEGFGALDSAHFSNICRCLAMMQSRFRSIILISHIDEIQTYIKDFVRVTRNERLLSQVNYGDPK